MLLIENPKYIQYDKSILSQLPDMGFEKHTVNDHYMRSIAIEKSKIEENTFSGFWWKTGLQVKYLYEDFNEKHRAGASVVFIAGGGSPIFIQEYTYIRLYRSVYTDINCKNSNHIVGLGSGARVNNVFIESIGVSKEEDIETITLPNNERLIIDYSRRNAYGEYYARIISK